MRPAEAEAWVEDQLPAGQAGLARDAEALVEARA